MDTDEHGSEDRGLTQSHKGHEEGGKTGRVGRLPWGPLYHQSDGRDVGSMTCPLPHPISSSFHLDGTRNDLDGEFGQLDGTENELDGRKIQMDLTKSSWMQERSR